LVELSGEFNFPGSYAILSRNEKLSNLIERAGGLTQFADAHSGILIRKRLTPAPVNQVNGSDNVAMPQLIDEVVFDTIAIDLLGIARNKSKYDLNVKNGDVVIVKATNNTVAVKGKVNSPVAVNHYAVRMRPYLRDAGGLSSEADKYRIYVIEPNGQARSTYRFLWMAKYPKVLPGSTIIVPEKPKNTEMQRDPARTAAVASIAASSAGVIIAIITLLR
jgi:protein involved in polysaccharide export with SLBB domain